MAKNLQQERFALWIHKKYFAQKFKRGAKLLELGCGDGCAIDAFTDLGYKVVGVDVVKLHPKTVCCDLEKKLPFKNASFDFVYANDVIEHVHNKELLWKEIMRVLKPKGLILVVIIDWKTEFKRYFNNFYHYTPYSEVTLRDIAHHFGLKVIALRKLRCAPFVWRFSDWGFEAFWFLPPQAIRNLALFEKVD